MTVSDRFSTGTELWLGVSDACIYLEMNLRVSVEPLVRNSRVAIQQPAIKPWHTPSFHDADISLSTQ
jgi:hypothetical protein